MAEKIIILTIIIAFGFLILTLSYDLLNARIKRFLPTRTEFTKISFLFLVIVVINSVQSLWIFLEITPRSFPIPGANYHISSRDFSDLNSLSKNIPTLYSIENLYIALDELSTKPQVYSIDKLIPGDSENQSKLYGTVWPAGEVKVTTAIGKNELAKAIKDNEPKKAGTVYATLKKIDPGIDWRIYSARNDNSITKLVVFSETKHGRQVWTFIDARLLNSADRQELK